MPHLPHYGTVLVGRAHELAAVATRLEGARLVTIVGAGGIGKTRLAVEVAAARNVAGEDVRFVDLATVADPELVPTAIAAAMGLELSAGPDLLASLVAALRAEHGLIVLDNCEHVLEGASAAAGSIARETPVRVLATSREPLGVEGEAAYRLDTLDDETSAALFIAHAAGVDRAFSADGRNALLVREICKRLDGIPLAIELVSACVRVMSLGQLRSRLDGRFRLVAKHRATPLARHETLEALIDWSYDLLTPRQRSVFSRLGVFNGNFSRDAALAVASGTDATHDEILTDLAELADKSMLTLESDAPPRYRMLESIRHYALMHLQEAGEERERRAAHFAHFAHVARDAAASFGTGSEHAWLERYAPDLDNFRAALDWSIANDADAAAELAAGLADLWEHANLSAEGLRRSEAILAALHDPSGQSALPACLAIGKTALPSRIYRRSLECGDRALQLAERFVNDGAAAQARRIAGRSRYLLAVEQQLGLSQLRNSLEYYREHGTPYSIARALRDYGSALAATEPELGRRLLIQALELARSIDWPRLTTHIEINVAEREFRSGNVAAAIARANDVIARVRQRRSPLQLAHALTNLCSYLSVTQAYDAALEAAREAVAIARAHESENFEIVPLQAVALVLAEQGHATSAARVLGFVDAFYGRYGMTREPTEEIVDKRLKAKLRTLLEPAALERELEMGRELRNDAATELAFSHST